MFITSSPGRRARLPDALLLIRVAAVALMTGLLWLGCVILGAGNDVGDAAQHSLHIAELRGRIAYLDETLNMAAHMAAWSGEPQWAERFDELTPSLDAAIAAATALADPDARRSLAETLNEAHRDIILMERRAFALIAAKDAEGARALLNGAEFHYLRDVFAAGLEVFGQDLSKGADLRASHISHKAWLRAFCFGLMAVLMVMALMAARQRVRLRAMASLDPLTQLPNRRQFYAHLEAVLQRSGSTADGRYVLVIVGIDRFKAINDSFGHAAADHLLQGVTKRLRMTVPSDAVLGRVGGDEFALLIDATASTADDDSQARLTVAALSKPYRLPDGRDVPLSVSAGVVWVASNPDGVHDVMRQADAALRQAKDAGRNCLKVFDHTMDAHARDRALLETELRHAIDRGEIVPFFQPVMDLKTGRVIGAEALARWNHPTRGWVSPATFIPLAEKAGLIDSLMERLLRQICREAFDWPADITVAFNVSPLQLRHDKLPSQIRDILNEMGFPACRLEVEITESALVTDLDLARRLLEDLRDSGVRLAIDDFGTGYSSLRHLRGLPFHKLKIDASFVGGMVEDRESGKIVAAMIGLGHSLGLSTVAEGVETPQVAAALRELGCDIGQGWLFGHPVPAAALDLRRDDVDRAA